MRKAKIAITIDEPILARIDKLVAEQVFSSRSQAIEAAVEEKIERLEHGRLARERVRVRPPCFANYSAFPQMLQGAYVADVAAALGSINIIAGELDR